MAPKLGHKAWSSTSRLHVKYPEGQRRIKETPSRLLGVIMLLKEQTTMMTGQGFISTKRKVGEQGELLIKLPSSIIRDHEMR